MTGIGSVKRSLAQHAFRKAAVLEFCRNHRQTFRLAVDELNILKDTFKHLNTHQPASLNGDPPEECLLPFRSGSFAGIQYGIHSPKTGEFGTQKLYLARPHLFKDQPIRMKIVVVQPGQCGLEDVSMVGQDIWLGCRYGFLAEGWMYQQRFTFSRQNNTFFLFTEIANHFPSRNWSG